MFSKTSLIGEARLINREYPHLRQWRDENRTYDLVKIPNNTGGQVIAGGINTVGKIVRGVFTLPDKATDELLNPNPPEPLQDGNLLPMTQRDVRKAIHTIFNRNFIKHPIGSAVTLASTAWNGIQSLGFDTAQKLGGGNYRTAA